MPPIGPASRQTAKHFLYFLFFWVRYDSIYSPSLPSVPFDMFYTRRGCVEIHISKAAVIYEWRRAAMVWTNDEVGRSICSIDMCRTRRKEYRSLQLFPYIYRYNVARTHTHTHTHKPERGHTRQHAKRRKVKVFYTLSYIYSILFGRLLLGWNFRVSAKKNGRRRLQKIKDMATLHTLTK